MGFLILGVDSGSNVPSDVIVGFHKGNRLRHQVMESFVF